MIKEALVEGLPELVGDAIGGWDGPRSFLGGLLSGGVVEGPIGHMNKAFGHRFSHAMPGTELEAYIRQTDFVKVSPADVKRAEPVEAE